MEDLELVNEKSIQDCKRSIIEAKDKQTEIEITISTTIRTYKKNGAEAREV